MKDFKALKFLDKFQSVFEKYGVDYTIMRKILQMKLLIDGRRVPTILKNSSKRKVKMIMKIILENLCYFI